MMKKLCAMLTVMALGSVFSGCGEDAAVVCDQFQTYVDDCWGSCVPGDWSCEINYDSLSAGEQDELADCADCLDSSSCSEDCSSGGALCSDLLVAYLGLSACE